MAITYTSEEEALYFLEDIMGRCQIPFILLGKVAKQVLDNIDVDTCFNTIEIGVKKTHLTESGLKSLKMLLGGRDVEYTDRFIKFNHKGKDVVIKIIHKDWAVLKHPNTVFYRLTDFKVPNPFNKYWSFKQFIR